MPKASQQPGEPEEIPREAAAEIPLETERAVTAELPEALKACVEAYGGPF
jgi:hypothetical protein